MEGAYAGRIAFASADGSVRSVKPDGASQVVLAAPEAGTAPSSFRGAFTWPVWSPDASSLLLSHVAPRTGSALGASLVLVAADGSGQPVIVYRDDSSSFGVGTGVPHYAVWSPDGSRIALVAGGSSGLVTVFVDPAGEGAPDVFVGGEPMFFAWSPDSRHLLVHHGDALRLVEFGDDGVRTGASATVGADSFEYLAPQFSGEGDHYLYAEPAGGLASVKFGRLAASGANGLTTVAGQIAFTLSPDGRKLAIATGADRRDFSGLTIVDAASGARTLELARPIQSFWWSPDSTRLAVASPAGTGAEALTWSVVDASTGAETRLGDYTPTVEFQFMQTFFDVYAHSHDIWSPDSRAIVVFASPSTTSGEPDRTRTAGQDASVWVLDASGRTPPRVVGDGYIGGWSPR
jgi:Tol biopolymer transport system component